jgi:glutamyl-tRNA reductase
VARSTVLFQVPSDAGAAAATQNRPPRPLQVVAFERSLATGSLERLERSSEEWSDDRARAAFDLDPDLREVAVLKTCHRLEVYAVVGAPTATARLESLLPRPRVGWRRRDGNEAVRHLFHVAAGLESLAVGEREVRAQVRRAGRRTISRLPTGGLRTLFDGAVDAAESLGSPCAEESSIAKIAAARILEEAGPPFPRIVVAGSGVVGRQVTEALATSARVTLLFRSQPPEEEFLRATGARAAPLTRLAEEIAVSDGLVTALKSAGRLVGRAELARRDPNRPLVVVDLGLPRNVDPAVAEDPAVRLIDLERLRGSSGHPGTEVASESLDTAAEGAYAGFRRASLEPFVAELWREAERLRVAEVERAAPYLASLAPPERAAVEKLTERLVRRLLATPTERLRQLSVEEEEATVRELAIRLFAPSASPP